MGEQAGAVVVELEAKLGNYQRDVLQGATTFDRSMKQIEGSASRAERTVGRSLAAAGQSSRLLGYQISDIGTQLASGQSPFLILAQQAPQVANALEGTTGAAGRMATFFSGPFGAALLAAASIIGIVIGKLAESGDETAKALKELQEHAKQTEAAEKAQKIYGNTLDGVSEALRTNRKALDELDAGQKTAARQALENAVAAKIRLESIRNETQALIDQARVHLEVKRIQSSGPGQRGELAALGLGQSSSTLDALETRLGSITNKITEADRQIQSALSHRVVELGSRDQVQKINDRYDHLIEQARGRAVAEKTVTSELSRQVKILNDQRDAEIKRAQDAAKPARRGNNSLTGREVSPAEAASIARAAGLQVNSSSRTYGQQKALYDAWVAQGMPKDNPVAVPGSSAHEGARGRWALDIQFGKGVTPELLRKVFADEGINLTKVFKERGHFHVEGSRSQADASQAIVERGKLEQTAAQLREIHDEFYTTEGPIQLFDNDDLIKSFDQIFHITDQTGKLSELIATFPPIPDLSKIISAEEQQRIDDWVMSFEQDVAGALTDAISQSKSLGDALVQTFKRAAAAMLESGILNFLSGGKQGVSFSSMITSIGGLFNKTPALPHTPGMASGGHVSGGHLYRVNETGIEGFQPAGQGKIIPLGQMAQAQGGGGTTVVNQVTIHANDAVLAATVRDWVTQGMQQAAVQGAIGGQSMTIDRLRRQQRRRLA
jgi:hypothetical protein